MTGRILAAMMALTAALLAGLVVPLGVATARQDRQVFTDRTIAVATAVANSVEEGLADRTPRSRLDPTLTRLLDGSRASVAVIDRTGGIVGLLGHLPPIEGAEVAAGLAGRTVVEMGEGTLTVLAPVRGSSGVVGVAVLSRSSAPVRAEVRRLWWALAAASVAAAAVAAGLAVALARWAGGPLRRLGRTVAAFGEGALDARAQLRRGPAEVLRLAAGFDEMAARLQALLDSHRTLVADVSHQLRTPLAAMRLRLELLASDAALAGHPARAAELETALSEVARLSRLVDGLLAVARAEHTPSAVAAVDVAALVADRALTWGPLCAERGLELQAGAAGPDPPGAPRALATPGHLEQVLDNLIANAVEAAPAGTRIQLQVRALPDAVELAIADHGPGMTEEQRRQAFRRFSSGRGEGIGLGLAVVHRLVTADGGAIALAETPGGGLTATVRLRRWRGAAPTDAPARLPEVSGASPGDAQSGAPPDGPRP